MKQTYFGLTVYTDDDGGGEYVRLGDIRKLPFYEFWEESAVGSTAGGQGGERIYLTDWISFSEMFIKTGRHRFQRQEPN